MSQPETQLPKNEPVALPKNITVYFLIDDSVLYAVKEVIDLSAGDSSVVRQ